MKYLLCLLCLPSWFLFGQTRPILNQYFLHQSTFNPGYLDPNTKFSFNGLYRRQWMRQNEFPEMGYLYGHYNFDRNHALGGIISNDLMNSINHFEIAVNYVYNAHLSKDLNLGLGMRVGVNEQNLLNSNLTYFDPVEPTLSSQPYSFTYLNAGAGVSLTSKILDVHLGLPYLFGNRFLNRSAVYNFQYNHLYLSAGYKIRFSDWFIMYPTAIAAAVRGSRVHGNFSLNFLQSQLIWYGLGLSSDFSANFSVGIFTMNGLRLLYSYDGSFFTKHNNTGVSHEVSINYGKTLEYNAFRKRKSNRRFISGGRRWR